MAFFSAAPPMDWVILAIFCLGMLALDVFAIRVLPETFRWHFAIVIFWICIAIAFNGIVWSRNGKSSAFKWATGYLLEWMLSLDNLFVFHLVINCYKCPANTVHKALFVGIIGAVVLRLVFFMVVSTLLHMFGWFRWPFGALLVWSGIEAARNEDDDDDDVSETRMVRLLKWLIGSRLYEDYSPEGPYCFIRDKHDGQLKATVLVVVIFCLEISDVLFALDSVSAKVAQIPDQYIAFSSSVLAMFGLRAMFFIIQDLVQMFEMLKYGLCIILIFIGVELMFAHYLHLASSTVCILIICIFGVCVVSSVALKGVREKLLKKQNSDGSKKGSKEVTNDKLVAK
jgi:tellurite resistance protein TerC